MTDKIETEILFGNGKRIRLLLDADAAPLSTDNFVKLANEGFYDGLCFHRVIRDFMIQGGGFTAGGGALREKNAPRRVKGEFLSNGVANPIKHVPGVISMARTPDRNSATSQFFICVAPCPFLDGEYAAFGQTADDESLKVALEISRVRTGVCGRHEDVPVDPVVIKSVTIL